MKTVDVNGPLQLINEGNLEIVFLGTGTTFARSLFQTNILLIKGKTHVLVDFGMTGPQALAALGRNAEDIEVVLPTHSHADHIGGIEYLTLSNRYLAQPKGKPKLTMLITDEYLPLLWEQSLRGGLEYNELNGEGKRFGVEDFYHLHIVEQHSDVERAVFRTHFNGLDIELFHTNHIPGEAETAREASVTYGLLVDNRVFISGDTKFDQELIDAYANRAEVFFHDASLKKNAVHASIDELRTLPANLRERMYLMHYQDETADSDASDFAGLALQGKRYIFPKR